MKPTSTIVTSLAACAFGLLPATAQAVPTIRLFDGTTTITIADQGLGDLNPMPGIVTWTGTIGQWIANTTTGLGNPVLVGPHLDLSSVNASNITGAPGFLDVLLSDVNFSFGAVSQLANFLGSIGGTTMGMVSWRMHVDDGNALFAQTTLIGSGTFTGGTPTVGFSSNFAAPTLVDGTFSMTLAVRIMHTNQPGQVTSFDFDGQGQPQQIPEPGTLLLIGAGLLGVVMSRRRRDS